MTTSESWSPSLTPYPSSLHPPGHHAPHMLHSHSARICPLASNLCSPLPCIWSYYLSTFLDWFRLQSCLLQLSLQPATSVIFQNANPSMSPKTLGWLLPALQIKSKFMHPGTQALHHLLRPHLPLLPSGTQSASCCQGPAILGNILLLHPHLLGHVPHPKPRLLLSEASHEAEAELIPHCKPQL